MQNEKIYQLVHQKNELFNRKQDAEFEKNLLSRKPFLEPNESIKQSEEKIKEYEESIQKIESEINELSQQSPTYDFSIKLDCQFATQALDFIENCENTNDDHVRRLISSSLNLLTKFIREYGANLDKEIAKNFNDATKYDSQGQTLTYSSQLDSKTSELLNIRNFSKVFQIIDGENKIQNWLKVFCTLYRDIQDKLQVADNHKNFEDSLKYVMVAKTLTSLDNFVKENGKNFESLFIEYKSHLLAGNREVINNILESISNLDFAQANELLSQITERPINQTDLKKIKLNLQTTLNKLMKEVKLRVRALDEIIESGYCAEKINYINESVCILDVALSKIELIDYLEPKTKTELTNFRNTIKHDFSNIVIKALQSIEKYLESYKFNEAEIGLKNIKKILDNLFECTLSEEAEKMMEKVNHISKNQIFEEIKKKDFSDITKYIYDPPVDILNILRDLASHRPQFRQTYAILLENVRKAVEKAISDVKNVSFEEHADKVQEIKFVLK